MRPSLQIPLVTLGGALAAATLFVWSNHWLGADDLETMVFWTLPLAFAVIPLLTESAFRLLWASTQRRTLILCAIGALAGLVWTAIVYVLLRRAVFDFSFPVIYCWMFGGICGGIAAGRIDPRH